MKLLTAAEKLSQYSVGKAEMVVYTHFVPVSPHVQYETGPTFHSALHGTSESARAQESR